MKYSFFVILTILFALFSCKNLPEKENSKQKDSHISGTLENGSGKSVLIQQLFPDRFETLDSIILDDNSSFNTSIDVDQPGFYAIRNEGGNYISFLVKENDSIHIKTDYYNFNRFELTGTEEVEEITRLNRATKNFLDEVAEYARIVSDSVESPNYTEIRLETDKKYRAAFNKLKNFSLDFIEKNKGSLITLLALTNQLGRDFFVFDPINDFQIFVEIDSILYEKYPESEAVQKIHSRIEMVRVSFPEEIKQLEVGDIAPEFRIRGPENQIHKLSDLKGNIILLDFWASWCAPCRKRNKELNSIYQEYKDKNFEILQISLDNQEEDWVTAIQKDNLNWLHGSELKFWDSEVAEKYGVNSIPASFLIDKEGFIKRINLSTEELEQELEDNLSKP